MADRDERLRLSELRSVADEVAVAVRELGSLSKRDIVEGWGIAEADYPGLRYLLARARGIALGPRRRGGFVARPATGAPPAESEGDELLMAQGWEPASVERLVELLQHRQLEELLGDLGPMLRQVRRQLTGSDRRGTKHELAAALVIQNGVDLLAQPAIRAAVARAARVESLRRWHSGGPGASRFVAAAGFPEELAGVPAPDSQPHFEWVDPYHRLPALEDFQKEIQLQLLVKFRALGERCIVTLPTGAGKTRTAVESIQFWLKDRYDPRAAYSRPATALWIAHTEELCEQAYACFRQVWSSYPAPAPLLLVRFWGQYTGSRDGQADTAIRAVQNPCVLVSTPNRLISLIRAGTPEAEEVLATLRGSISLIVIDEAHRAAAPAYREILKALAGGEEATAHGDAEVSVIGLTATPFRMEYLDDDPEGGTRELKRIFGDLVEPAQTLGSNPRARLQDRGILATPVWETLESETRIRIDDVSLGQVLTEGEIEKVDRRLALRADNSARRLLLLQRLLEICQDRDSHVLYFGPSVRDADCMAFLLRRERIAAGSISGDTRNASRRQIVQEFRSGRLQVLCNCQVLTTGFDDPRVTHVVMGRPTVSRVLYEQMVGRGLRGPRFGGTAACRIVDCQDQIQGFGGELGYEAFRRVWSG